MTLMRKQVRAYFVNRLLNNTNARDRVNKSGMTVEEGPWPLIGVYTPLDENIDEVTDSGDYEIERQITVEVESVVKQENDFDDSLDDLCEQIQNLIDYDMGGMVQSCTWQKDEIVSNPEGETNFTFCKSTFHVIYRWAATPLGNGNPANLNTIHIDEDMYAPNNGTVIGPDGQIDMVAHITNLNPP